MKSLISILSFLLLFTQSYSQDLDSLNEKMIGTWELVNYLSTNNSTGNQGPDKIRRTRVNTRSHFTQTLYDPSTGKMFGNMTGSYALSNPGGVAGCRDLAFSVTPGMEVLLNKSLIRSVSIDEGDRLIFTWTSNDIQFTEVWSRVVREPMAQSQVGDSLLRKKIQGTWDLLKFNYGPGQATDQSKWKFRRLKLYNASSYTVTDIDVNTNMTKTAFLGNYFVGKSPSTKGNYEENKLPVSDSIPKQEEGKFVCNAFIDAADQLHFEWVSDGVKCSETWMRIGELKQDYFMQSIGVEAKPGTKKLDPKTVYVLSSSKGEVIVKSTSSHPNPFMVFPREAIVSIEFQDDVLAVQKYGMRAIPGVIILKVNDEALETGLKKLREQKNIE